MSLALDVSSVAHSFLKFFSSPLFALLTGRASLVFSTSVRSQTGADRESQSIASIRSLLLDDVKSASLLPKLVVTDNDPTLICPCGSDSMQTVRCCLFQRNLSVIRCFSPSSQQLVSTSSLAKDLPKLSSLPMQAISLLFQFACGVAPPKPQPSTSSTRATATAHELWEALEDDFFSSLYKLQGTVSASSTDAIPSSTSLSASASKDSLTAAPAATAAVTAPTTTTPAASGKAMSEGQRQEIKSFFASLIAAKPKKDS